MDEIVKAALKKWPNVPSCVGWLGLDARGDWYMRDEQVQAAGPFEVAKGSRIEHALLRAFIERNYAGDEVGRWHFQNGPQRVYVELEAAPWVWRLVDDPTASDGVALSSHTGLAASPQEAWLDERGRLFLLTELGLGLVHTLDMAVAADAVSRGAWTVQSMPFDEMPGRFGHCLSPRLDPAEKKPAA